MPAAANGTVAVPPDSNAATAGAAPADAAQDDPLKAAELQGQQELAKAEHAAEAAIKAGENALDDAQEAAAAQGKKTKKGILGLLTGGGGGGGGEASEWERLAPRERSRWWELTIELKSFETFTTKDSITFFFCMSVLSEDPKKHYSRVQLPVKFTPIFTLGKGELRTLSSRFAFYDRKTFALSYKELDRHVIKLDSWEVSTFTFNTYFGFRKVKLSKVADGDPNQELMMKKKLSKAQSGKKGQALGDVARINTTVSLEEIFDFRLNCDNWTFTLEKHHPDVKNGSLTKKDSRKRLTFVMPRDLRSMPGRRQFLAGGVTSKTFSWNQEEGNYFWASCGQYTFRGTRTHLRSSFFVIYVHTGNPPQMIIDAGEAAQKATGVFMQRLLGQSLMNLTSVLNISAFKADVKAFQTDKKRYMVGSLSGNVKCLLISRGQKTEEMDFRDRRPEQLKSSTSVSHLKRDERHLVVKVFKCDSLPAADADTGLSDPLLRVSWDNVVQETPPIKQSLRPVFNEAFYFPVRLVFPQLRGDKAERKYEKSLLSYELESKGSIKIEVWDDDTTSADFLGGCTVTIHDILSQRFPKDRSLLGASKKKVVTDEDDDDAPKDTGGQMWFEKEKPVRVFDGSKTPLSASMLSSSGSAPATIHFEAYFFPDWAPALSLDSIAEEGDDGSKWKNRNKELTSMNEEFARLYAEPFPDSLGAKKCSEGFGGARNEQFRRFNCIARHPQTFYECPLMSFLSSIIVPQEYSFPARLLHWVHCLSFELSTKQQRTGLIPPDGWKDSEYIMARRKGAAQDHAILLCSLLLGCKKDAYVVKGTVRCKEEPKEPSDANAPKLETKELLMEHVWVMTREEEWVTFWEPCSRQVFHLPKRYTVTTQTRRRKKKKKKDDDEAGEDEEGNADDDEEEEEDPALQQVSQWDGEVADARISIADMEALPTVGRNPKPKQRVANKKKALESRDAARARLMNNREKLQWAPRVEMLKPDTAVTWLPYDSIEVVFNRENLWINRQNHHPACINYDFPDGQDDPPPGEGLNAWLGRWEPMLKQPDFEAKSDMKFRAITPNVSILPALREDVVDRLTVELRTEMQQNLQLYRGKRGFDTFFDTNESLTEHLLRYLNVQEKWLQIDPDGPGVTALLQTPDDQLDAEEKFMKGHLGKKNPKVLAGEPEGMVRQWNERGSPFFGDNPNYKSYRDLQDQLWKELKKDVASFLETIDNFPTKRGKRFRGFPVHFSTSDADDIRSYLMELPLYQEFINADYEDIWYTIECQIFPLLGGVLSVWMYIGIQDPQIAQEDAAPA
eukprot:TRINITY_DN18288_c0_g2_i2.p1 TRINITY_DN18288_c0_g2~~TRINITY_DN18288_c0_g2_i2.p1  ORF type:complete len:1297 (+),score=415.46 TRINITY_DN18288_c0_g2_i2:172-4062(+)